MKIVFLDIDGVLNSSSWTKTQGEVRKALEANGVHKSMLEKEAADLDPRALRLLQKLIDVTQAVIVLSSSWRKLYDKADIIEMFAQRGYQDAPIIDITPNDRTVGAIRGNEVKAWLEGYNHVPKYDATSVEKWLCIDDDSDFLPGQKLIQTDSDIGLQDSHVQEAITYLNA